MCELISMIGKKALSQPEDVNKRCPKITDTETGTSKKKTGDLKSTNGIIDVD